MREYPPPVAATFRVSECLLQPQLSRDTYSERMHQLLCIEEMAQFSNIAKYVLLLSLKNTCVFSERRLHLDKSFRQRYTKENFPFFGTGRIETIRQKNVCRRLVPTEILQEDASAAFLVQSTEQMLIVPLSLLPSCPHKDAPFVPKKKKKKDLGCV